MNVSLEELTTKAAEMVADKLLERLNPEDFLLPVAKLKEGDLVVLEYPGVLTRDAAKNIVDELFQRHGVKAIVLEEGMKLARVREKGSACSHPEMFRGFNLEDKTICLKCGKVLE